MSSHYKIFKSTKGGYYSFRTKNDYTYRCFFTRNTSSNSLLGLDVDSPVFFFAFSKKDVNTNGIFDRSVGLTIAEILNRFFNKNPLAIICYICENGDMKALKRQVSFEKWFITNNCEPKKILIKGEVVNIIYVGAILISGNPETKKISNHFKRELKKMIDSEKSGTIDIIS